MNLNALTQPQPDQDRNRWVALYVLCAGMLMIVLDVTVVNVALPSIRDDLGFSQSSLAWVVNAYLIAFGGLLLLAGRFGDLLGRKNIFMTGLAVFTVASVLCGAAQSQEMLVVARFIQGIGGAMTSAVILGMIVTMFPERSEQAKAIGVYAFVASAGGTIGLLAGGVLTEAINWHWIFFINVPIAIVTAFLATRLIDRDQGIGLAEGADTPGAILITTSLMLGVYTIVKPAADYGWTDGQTLGLGAASLALLIAFIVRESRAENPIMPLRIFRSRNVSGANVVQALLVAGMFGTFFMGSLYMQEVLGYDALEIGLAFLPATLIMGTLSVRYAEPIIMRFGARRALLAGMVLVAGALALFTRAPVDGGYVEHILPVMILLGFGIGVCFPALMTIAMSGATQADAGLASGLVNTSAQVGGAIGLAVLATLSATRSDKLIADGEANASALTSGYHLAFLLGAMLVVVSIVLAAVVIEPDAELAAEAAGSDDEQASSTEPAYSEAA
ncbi:MAG TPA: MFS transporter [Solirubrobacterales bacterium]|jgi:EmrB/QacA subfamily drug resistance transporter